MLVSETLKRHEDTLNWITRTALFGALMSFASAVLAGLVLWAVKGGGHG